MPPLRVGIIHPDLGIGGAERLIVDAALGLQRAGYNVQIFTSHHDPEHSFEETNDGTLKVQTFKTWLPRAILGRLHIVFANLRQLHLTGSLISGISSGEIPPCDIYIVDQLSTCIPLLRRIIGRRVVFYCHFPDKLLADGSVAPSDGIRKSSTLKNIYRFPSDWIEEYTTKQADAILANSKFTAGVFKTAFPSIQTIPRVVYPGINIPAYELSAPIPPGDLGDLAELLEYPTLLTLNRFEKKKNLALALETFSAARKDVAVDGSNTFGKPLRLVVGGGFDERIVDNVHTLTHLTELAAILGLTFHIISATPLPTTLEHLNQLSPSSHGSTNITFLLNFTTAQRSALLHSPKTVALLYTPTNEHFGIGPVEGMICGLPVIACNSGGPIESIIPFPLDSSSSSSISSMNPKPTGFLVEPTQPAFTAAVLRIISLSPSERSALSKAAQARAKSVFSLEAMSDQLVEVITAVTSLDAGPKSSRLRAFWEKRELDQNSFAIARTGLLVLALLGALLIYLDIL